MNTPTIPIRVKPISQSLDYILEHSCSVARFGDGEMDIIAGHSIPYQDYDPQLASELKEILGLESNQHFMVCLSDVFENRERYTDACNHFWEGHLQHYQDYYRQICKAPWYGSTFISRPYIDLADKSVSAGYFQSLKQIWTDKDILIVEGKTSRSGVGNDLFQEAKSIQRIICPSKNAYSQIEDILTAIQTYGQDKLVLLMLGPTAKVLAYRLSKTGMQAIDIGHIDSEYEWFTMQAQTKIKLQHKHTAEHNFDQDIIFTEDQEYLQQIVLDLTGQVLPALQESKTLDIAFSVNNRYAQYLGATILSILAHHPKEEVRVHILYKEIAQSILQDLDNLAQQTPNLELHFHLLEDQQFSAIPIRTEQFPFESFSRFLLPELLADLDRILYLDVDILVHGNLMELFQTDLEGYALGAVVEADIFKYYQWYLDSLGFSPNDAYFSSGVLLMDLDKMRQNGTTNQLIAMALEKAQDYNFPDQDILNLYYKGNFKQLSPAYNYTDVRKQNRELATDEIIIEHFNGDIKAWHAITKIPDYLQDSALTYQDYQTQFLTMQDKPLVSIILPIREESPHLKGCLETISEQTYRNLEVLLLQDRPYGHSQDLADRYQRDLRIKLLTLDRQNTSLEQAGIKWANGDYLAFVRQTDWLNLEYIECLLTSLTEKDCQIAQTSFAVFDEEQQNYLFYSEEFPQGTIMESKEVLQSLYGMIWFEKEGHETLFGKLFHAQIFSPIFHRQSLNNTKLAYLAYLTADKVVISRHKLYVRRFKEKAENLAILNNKVDDLAYLFTLLCNHQLLTVDFTDYYKEQVQQLTEKMRRQYTENLNSCSSLSTPQETVTLLVNAWKTRESSLRNCLDSIFNQDYPYIDVVVLMSDKQSELEDILAPYLINNRHVTVIKKDFSNKIEAYQVGLTQIKSSYFSMIEAEDWLDKTHISSLYHQLVEENALIASTAFTLFEENDGIYKIFEVDIATGSRTSSYLLENLFGLKWYEYYRHTHLDGKLYHSSILQKAGALANYQSEDLLVCLFYLVGESVAFVNNRTYVKRNVSIVQPTFETEGGILQRMKELNQFASYMALCNLSLIHYKEFYKQELYSLLVTTQKLEKEELATKIEAKLNELQFLEQLPHHKPFY
ncbi:SP_1767 family glycosyltransferase [Streptococcus suis]|uniref:SP_1767 family glycosyltransferase n=1 Tax=Streptococcus suis TaxID=1307 RepID=A0A9X4MSM9_STRSU|nr:SP_1767 family glycosyltransferase [Streptococcus suis]MDG4526668.1 SP_1767 family glycosyltransferase [Streptococcus suis]MDG4529064.1 SP_1767 family glycosyltransferase [Streptococcus suis]